jgi:hypothetical protein
MAGCKVRTACGHRAGAPFVIFLHAGPPLALLRIWDPL